METRKPGMVARRAAIRWAWRLFRREWRQQVLIVALIALAVGATIFGAAVAENARSSGITAAFGTANEVLTLRGADRHLASDLAAVKHQFGTVDVIENQTIPIPGSVNTIDLRAQDPDGRYGRPTLARISGHYPSRPDEVALTKGVASLLNLGVGDRWRYGGHARRITGLVENPSNLLDQFALVPPGQVSAPTQVTVLFDTGGPSPVGLQFPGGATPQDRVSANNAIGPASAVLIVAAFGLIFIGLVAVAGFTVIAQRRLRALGMLGALGATDNNVRLVIVAGGAITGILGTLTGAALGLLAWVAYAPHLQTSVAHRVTWSNLPWSPIAAAIGLAVGAAVAAAWRPARSAARIPVVAALSGRPAPVKASRRSAAAGIILLAAGLWSLASAGGWPGLLDRHVIVPSVLTSTGGWATAWTGGMSAHVMHRLVAGIVATALGTLLIAPRAVAVPTIAGRHAPVAVRLALRDLRRYRARSGSVLAAVTFAVLTAVVICILATARPSGPLTSSGPNLAANQLIAYVPHGRFLNGPHGSGPEPTEAKLHALRESVNALASSLHARSVLALYSAGRLNPGANIDVRHKPTFGTNQRTELWQTSGRSADNYQQLEGSLYVATPALLHLYGISPSHIAPDTDILTSRAALAAMPNLELLGQGDIASRHTPSGQHVSTRYECRPASCIAEPKIQTFTSLPAGTSAPNTVITEHALRRLGQQLIPDGWLIQTAGPLTVAQQNTARQLALADGTLIETSSGEPHLSTIRDWATTGGILVALAVLTMTVGLIRSETANERRTLTAVGASSTIRRTVAGATAGTLGLLGALLGTTVAYLAVIAWAHNSLSTTLTPVPAADLTAILLGLPLAATIGGWLLGGREPPAFARQPLE